MADDGMIGRFIGDYQITGKLGEGGMGVVFKGLHPTLGQLVAVKMLHPNLVKAESIKQRFVTEAKAMARLRHPNILQLYNFVDNADGCFIIMEFVEGKTFEALLEESNIVPPERAVDLFIPTLKAMQYAHSEKIIHRDIKPSNIMLLNSGVVKVMDFGTAKMQGGPALTAAGMTLGTVVYMSPEQLMGRDLTPAADIYSLGVTLYEMCTGRLPFYHDNEMQLMKMIMKEPAPPPSSVYAGVPKSLEKVILRAIEKDKTKRFQSADEFAAALEGVKAELAGGKAPKVPSAPSIPVPPPQQVPAQAPHPPATADLPEETQLISKSTPVPAIPAPAPAPGGTSSLVIVGALLAGLGLVGGGLLLALGVGGVIVGVAVLALLVGMGLVLVLVGLKQKPAAAPYGEAAPGTRTCPTCNRALAPSMATCPSCSGQAKAGASGTDGALPAATGSAFLDVIDGMMKGQRLSLPQQSTTIGRAPDNTICFKDPSVSSHHARIDYYQGKFFVSDLQSSNGTFVNNKRVDQHELKNQDLIALGSTRVIISC